MSPSLDPPISWSGLRQAAVAAKNQLEIGPREWPGRPSRQRLEFFLAASPDVILALLDERDSLVTRTVGGVSDA